MPSICLILTQQFLLFLVVVNKFKCIGTTFSSLMGDHVKVNDSCLSLTININVKYSSVAAIQNRTYQSLSTLLMTPTIDRRKKTVTEQHLRNYYGDIRQGVGAAYNAASLGVHYTFLRIPWKFLTRSDRSCTS